MATPPLLPHQKLPAVAYFSMEVGLDPLHAHLQRKCPVDRWPDGVPMPPA
jgi:hypothetical protein